MLISISRRKKKQKSPDAQARSDFLKMLFGKLSGTYGISVMKQYVSGNYKEFAKSWATINEYVLSKSIEVAKELKKYEEPDAKANAETQGVAKPQNNTGQHEN